MELHANKLEFEEAEHFRKRLHSILALEGGGSSLNKANYL